MIRTSTRAPNCLELAKNTGIESVAGFHVKHAIDFIEERFSFVSRTSPRRVSPETTIKLPSRDIPHVPRRRSRRRRFISAPTNVHAGCLRAITVTSFRISCRSIFIFSGGTGRGRRTKGITSILWKLLRFRGAPLTRELIVHLTSEVDLKELIRIARSVIFGIA